MRTPAGLGSEDGFTLLELMIVVVISAIVLTIAGQFIGRALRSYGREETKTALQANTKQAVESVAREVRYAQRSETNNGNPDLNAPGAPGNLFSWTSSTGSGATLILGVPARDSSGNLIYVDIQHNSIYLNDTVYFVDPTSKILYRRVIKNPSAVGNTAITTCPPAVANASCPADAKVVADVADLITAYLDANNNSIGTPAGTEAVQITLKQTRVKASLTYVSDYTTIASLRNK